jgi:hypothetical protein
MKITGVTAEEYAGQPLGIQASIRHNYTNHERFDRRLLQ